MKSFEKALLGFLAKSFESGYFTFLTGLKKFFRRKDSQIFPDRLYLFCAYSFNIDQFNKARGRQLQKPVKLLIGTGSTYLGYFFCKGSADTIQLCQISRTHLCHWLA